MSRQAEKARCRARQVQHQVEEPRRRERGSADEGQAGVDFRHQHRSRQPAQGHLVEQIEGQVRVATQAQAPRGITCHLVHHQVGPPHGHRPRHVRVVEAGVVLLRLVRTQQGAGLQVELLDAYVARQRVAALRQAIGERREVGAEVPFKEGREEARLQAGARRGRRQRQRGIDFQRALVFTSDRGVDRVEQAVRLAQAERAANTRRGPQRSKMAATVDSRSVEAAIRSGRAATSGNGGRPPPAVEARPHGC